MSLAKWYILETWWRVLTYVSLMEWYVLETWYSYTCVTREVAHTGDSVSCSCIHGTSEVALIGHMVLLHTCHLWSGTYWRRGALAYLSLVKWNVLETWCSCILVTYEVARTRDLVLCSCIYDTCEVTCTGDSMLLHTYHLWSDTYWRLGLMLLYAWHLWGGMY